MANTLTSQFPDEFATPREKVQPSYGLQYFRAAYFANAHYNGRIFFGNTEFDALEELAQGRASEGMMNRLMNQFNFSQNAKGDEQGSLAWIDAQILPLTAKYVNKAVSKLQRNKYDCQLSAVDLLSIDESKSYAAKIKTIYQLRDFYTTLSVDPQAFFPDIDLGLLPQYADELIFNYNANPKLKKIIDGEKSLKLIQQINDMDQVMREYDWDLVVKGRGHLHCWLDGNNVPRIASINAKYWGGAYVENDDYSKAPYQFFIEFIPRDQFKSEAEDFLTNDQIQKVLTGYAFQNTQLNATAPYTERFDGLDYIPVMRCYFLSNDNKAYKRWTNKFGNPQQEEVPYTYQAKKRERKEEFVPNKYTSVYGGTWVIDSDVVYNYRRLDMPRTNLVNAKLPIISFAPNQKQGRVVSLTAQMIESIYMINVAWNKIKGVLADGFLGVLELDFTAMEEISLGQGGEKWTSRQVYEHFLKTKRLIKRRNTNPYGQSNGKAIEESASGLQMADYFNTIRQAIVFLDDLTGSAAVESSVVPDRMTTEVMQQNLSAGNESLEYLVNGHVQAYKQASHILLMLLQTAKKNKATIRGMIPALGKYTTEYFEVPDDIAYCEYGLFLERQPSPEEWIELYQELRESVANGHLNSSDSAFIREIDNLKMARQVMANREAINEKKNAQMLQDERKFQMDIAKQTTEGKAQAELAILNQKKNDEMELMQIQARIDAAMMERELMLKGMNEVQIKQIEERIKKQAGIDTIIKEAMRSQSDQAVAREKSKTDLITGAMNSAQKAISDREKAKAKPKPVTK